MAAPQCIALKWGCGNQNRQQKFPNARALKSPKSTGCLPEFARLVLFLPEARFRPPYPQKHALEPLTLRIRLRRVSNQAGTLSCCDGFPLRAACVAHYMEQRVNFPE